ncbi:MAG: serine hydrolase domain-containing protein [Bacteroidota bacterium]
MRNLILLLIVLCLPLCSNYGQTFSNQYSTPLSYASPASQGMSATRLSRIDKMLEQTLQEDILPGAVAIVVRNGKIVYHKAFGVADANGEQALKRDDIFRIASQTKAITSTAVMMLWEEGHFRLDDPIEQYLPAFANPQVLDTFNEADSTFTTRPAKGSITIRHLLTHTSGLGYGFIDGDPRFRKMYAKAGIIDAFTDQDISIQENVKKLAKLPLHQDPGERYTYAVGLDVLGYLVEVISGQSFDRFLQERIFRPLGMSDTYFYLPDSKKDRLVEVQRKVDGAWRIDDNPVYNEDYPISGAKAFFSGGAGLSSTAKDYATFLQMYLNKGELNGVRLLSRTTVDLIMSDHMNGRWREKGRYHGLAFAVQTPAGAAIGGRGSVGTFEWGGYFNSQYFADPQEQVIGVILKQTQGARGDVTGWKFKQLVGAAVDN